VDDKLKTFNYLKHGFTADDVFIRLTPLSKKSITQMIQLYNVPINEPGHRFVEVRETYRWGCGFREGDDLNWPSLLMPQNGITHCDPYVGHGNELDDLCGIWFDYDGDWTDEQKEDFEQKWYNGDDADDDGRSGLGWVHDYQEEWQVEDEQIIIDGEVEDIKYDVIHRNDFTKIFIEDYKPQQEEDNG